MRKFLRLRALVWAYFWKIWVAGIKKKFSHFWVLFCLIFSKNDQKVKVSNLARNGWYHQIVLKTCYLRSLDTMWYILYHSIGSMIFCDMRNPRHKIEILAKKQFPPPPKQFFFYACTLTMESLVVITLLVAEIGDALSNRTDLNLAFSTEFT